jgi:hypothetical protein
MPRRISTSVALAVLVLMAGLSSAQAPGRRPTPAQRQRGGAMKKPAPRIKVPQPVQETPSSTVGDRWDFIRRPRPSRQQVDLSDATACYRELAELASFALFFNGMDDFRANAAGSAFGARLDTETLDRIVRFDHLSGSADPQFRALADEVRAIWLDCWRLNRAFFMAYSDYGTWTSPFEPMRLPWAQHNAYVQRIEKEARKAATHVTYHTETSMEPTGTGGFRERTVKVPEEYVDTSKYKYMYIQLKKKYEPEMSRFDRHAAELGRMGLEKALAQDKEMLAARQSLVICRRRMARLWTDRLLPKLKENAGPDAPAPLVAIGQPSLIAPQVAHIAYGNAGAVLIHNATRRTLHHAAAEITLRNSAGLEERWYAYLPALAPSQFVVSNYSGVVFRPGGALIGIGELGGPIEVTLNLHCDEGRDMGRRVVLEPQNVQDVIKSQNGQGNLLEQLAKALLPDGEEADGAAPPHDESVVQPGNATVIPKEDDAVNAEAKARYRAYRQGTRRIDPLPADPPIPADRADSLLNELRNKYPGPESPDAARRRIASTIQPGKAMVTGGGPLTVEFTLEFEPFDENATEIRGRMTRTEGRGESVTDGIIGRFVEDVPRGCVIALIHDRPIQRKRDENDARIASAMIVQNKNAALELKEIQAKDREKMRERLATADSPAAKAILRRSLQMLEKKERRLNYKQEVNERSLEARKTLNERMKDETKSIEATIIEALLQPDTPMITDQFELSYFRNRLASRKDSPGSPARAVKIPDYVVFVDASKHVQLQARNQITQSGKRIETWHQLRYE